jgi:hypothetical protein
MQGDNMTTRLKLGQLDTTRASAVLAPEALTAPRRMD